MLSLGITLYRLERFSECEKLSRKVLQISQRVLGPENSVTPSAHNDLALAIHRQGRLTEAAENYRKALEIGERVDGTKNPVVMMNLAICGGGLDSRQLLREALEISKRQHGEEHIQTASIMFWLSERAGDAQESEELRRKALAIQERVLGPDHPKTRLSRANLAYRAGNRFRESRDYDQAIVNYSEAIRLHPAGMHMFYANRGLAYSAIGEWEKAIADYDSAIQNHQAIRDYTEVIRLDPQHALSYQRRSICHLQVGTSDNAVHDAKQAITISPNEATFHNSLGVALYRAGNWNATVETLTKSMELGQGANLSFDAFFLAMAHWQLGEKEKARELYDQAVEWMDKNRPDDEELVRFRAEAEKLLGVNVPAVAPGPADQKAEIGKEKKEESGNSEVE